MRIFAGVLCVCVTFFLFPCGDVAIIGEKEKSECTVFCGALEEGIFEVVVEIVSSAGLCGVFCSVEYDEERLVLLSLGVENDGAEISHADLGGEVRFLIDSASDIGNRVAVSLFFAEQKGTYGLAEVSVGVVEAYCFEDGEPRELEIDMERDSIRLDFSDGGGGRLPVLTAHEYVIIDGEVALRVRGNAGRGRVFGGVELFVVREDGGGEKIFISRALALSENGDFELMVQLGDVGRRSIIITPVVFEREGCVRGEKVVIIE